MALLIAVLVWQLVRRGRRRRRGAPNDDFAAGDFATKSNESVCAAGEPAAGAPPETASLVTPFSSASMPSPLRAPGPARAKDAWAVPTVDAGRSPKMHAQPLLGGTPNEKRTVGLSWAGQRSLGSAVALSGTGHDVLSGTGQDVLSGTTRDASSSTSGPSTSLALPAEGAFPFEARPAAEAIATEELLRELDARGVLPAAQEPPPVYEEASR
jgi:hypothetical protein